MKRISMAACVFVLLMLGACTQAGEDGTASAPEDGTASVPLYVDDFEDGDKDNIIGTWYTDLTTVNTFDTVAPPPGNGSYALNLQKTMKADFLYGGSLYFGASNVNTGNTTSATPVDVSSYERICFGLSFFCFDSVKSTELKVSLSGSNDTNMITYELLSDSDSDFKDYSLPLSEFTVNNGTLFELKESVEQLMFKVITYGTNGDTLEYSLYIDDVRFE